MKGMIITLMISLLLSASVVMAGLTASGVFETKAEAQTALNTKLSQIESSKATTDFKIVLGKKVCDVKYEYTGVPCLLDYSFVFREVNQSDDKKGLIDVTYEGKIWVKEDSKDGLEYVTNYVKKIYADRELYLTNTAYEEEKPKEGELEI